MLEKSSIFERLDEFKTRIEIKKSNLNDSESNIREKNFTLGKLDGELSEMEFIKEKLSDVQVEIANIINYIDQKTSTSSNKIVGEYRLELTELDKIDPSTQTEIFDYNRGVIIGKIDCLINLKEYLNELGNEKALKDTNASDIKLIETEN
jgi:hypothetical protein